MRNNFQCFLMLFLLKKNCFENISIKKKKKKKTDKNEINGYAMLLFKLLWAYVQ